MPIRLSPLLLPALLLCVLGTSPASAQAVGPEFRVNTYTTDIQQRPRIAIDSGGNFVVVWQSNKQDDPSSYGVFGQRYGSAGAPFGVEFRVNAYTTDNQRFPSVASDAGGNFVVVWASFTQGGSNDGVFGQRYASAGAPLGAEFRVNTYIPGSQSLPSVASGSGGSFVVVWQSYKQDGSYEGVFGQRYSSTGAALGAEFQVNTYTTGKQNAPSVASDSGGNFVVVWQGYYQDGSSYGVFGRRYTSTGSPLGAEFQVNTFTTSRQSHPSVTSDSGGSFVVVWQSYNQDVQFYGVFGQRYSSAGTPLGTEFRVNTYTTHNQSYPSVTSDPGGNFVVVWQSYTQDGSNFGVFGQRYDSAGAPLGTEVQVNTYTTRVQRSPSVASDPGGHFVVVWQTNIQDGTNDNVFGQRFCSPLASVTISVVGAAGACTTSTGGTATVTDAGGGVRTHQWGFRVAPGDLPFAIFGQTGTSYLINGADFPGAGFYYLVCYTYPECGSITISNDVTIFIESIDLTPPAVSPPPALTTTQTLCM